MFQWFIVRTSSSTELRHIIQISPCKEFFGQSLPWLKLSLVPFSLGPFVFKYLIVHSSLP